MKTVLKWNDGMAFDAETASHSVRLDANAPLGRGSGPTPKDLVAMGLGGCTAMDVIALLKKHRQLPNSFSVSVDITPTQGAQPVLFKEAALLYSVQGEIEPGVLLDAVRRSQTQYCGVSAMLAQAFPIRYEVELNGSIIGSGNADFQISSSADRLSKAE